MLLLEPHLKRSLPTLHQHQVLPSGMGKAEVVQKVRWSGTSYCLLFPSCSHLDSSPGRWKNAGHVWTYDCGWLSRKPWHAKQMLHSPRPKLAGDKISIVVSKFEFLFFSLHTHDWKKTKCIQIFLRAHWYVYKRACKNIWTIFIFEQKIFKHWLCITNFFT